MLADAFQKIYRAIVERESKVLDAKSVHYESKTDKLRNFKVGAALAQTSQATYLKQLFIKHLTSIFIYIDEMDDGTMTPIEKWSESISDARNYLALLEMVTMEKLEETNKTKYDEIMDRISFKGLEPPSRA
jgi:hypothetical protein